MVREPNSTARQVAIDSVGPPSGEIRGRLDYRFDRIETNLASVEHALHGLQTDVMALRQSVARVAALTVIAIAVIQYLLAQP